MTDPSTPTTPYRAGFVSFVGRPNVGKSTLTNALVGEKIAITSSKPQTTRRAIRGIVHRPDGQLIVVDTPGIHRPRTLLGERLNSLVTSTLGDVDVIGMLFPADEPIGPGDRFINEQLEAFPRARKVAIDEANAVARSARDHHSPGSSWSDQAVLVRTNAQAALMSESFTKAEAKALLSGEMEGFFAPPPLAIAHQLIKAWAEEA